MIQCTIRRILLDPYTPTLFFSVFNMSCETYENRNNPLDPVQSLIPPPSVPDTEREAHPQNTILDEDSAVTKAEKIERHRGPDDFPKSHAKRIKVDVSADEEAKGNGATTGERRKGVAPIKPESVSVEKQVSMESL